MGFLLGYILFGTMSIRMNAILIGSFIIVVTGMIDDIKNNIDYMKIRAEKQE